MPGHACAGVGVAVGPTLSRSALRALHSSGERHGHQLLDCGCSPAPALPPAAPPPPPPSPSGPIGAMPNSGANSSSASTTCAAVGRRRRSPSQQRSMSDCRTRVPCHSHVTPIM
jgi:hypothetical protein